MKLYLISRTDDNDWDTYDSAVVAAPDEETARNMNPANGYPMEWGSRRLRIHNSWCDTPEMVSVSYLGEAANTLEHGVVCSSFNAG